MKYQFPENFGGVLQPAVLKQKAFLKVMVKVKTFGILVSRSARKIFQQVGPDKTSQFYKNTKKIFS